jgi:hypothetical protein
VRLQQSSRQAAAACCLSCCRPLHVAEQALYLAPSEERTPKLTLGQRALLLLP